MLLLVCVAAVYRQLLKHVARSKFLHVLRLSHNLICLSSSNLNEFALCLCCLPASQPASQPSSQPASLSIHLLIRPNVWPLLTTLTCNSFSFAWQMKRTWCTCPVRNEMNFILVPPVTPQSSPNPQHQTHFALGHNVLPVASQFQ